MSAWVVSPAHIDVLVTGLIEHEIAVALTPTEIGRELYEECVRSVTARYGDDRANLPGHQPILEVDAYEYRKPEVELVPIHFSAAAACDGYQACEHAEWETSTAAGWVAALAKKVPRVSEKQFRYGNEPLDAAHVPWGFSEEQVHPPALPTRWLIRETVEYQCEGTREEAEVLRDNAILVDARKLDEAVDRHDAAGQLDLDCQWSDQVIEEAS